MRKTKVAFLYSEVAGYFMACARELAKSAEVLIVRWPVNKEAPFRLTEEEGIRIVDKSSLDPAQLVQLVRDFDPDILVCSGWMDKTYLEISRKFRKKIPVVLTLDNHWTGSLRQRIARLYSPFFLKKIFTHAWVPGQPQRQFAKKLGFDRILTDFYCCDADFFNRIFQSTFSPKKSNSPKRFLYVGRYVRHKGIFEMFQAFIDLQNEMPNEWELWCLGTGDQWDKRIEHPKIKHFGFVQPGDLEPYIAQTTAYVLPSQFEPWGVSVQEFAICGFPLILSDAVGSREKFLVNNGFVFKNGSTEDLKSVMKKMILLDRSELIRMSEESHQLGTHLTPAMWSDNLLTLLPSTR